MTRSGAKGALDPVAQVRASLEAGARVSQALADTQAESIARAAEMVAAALGARRRALLFGNGGSAADAQHIAAEWTGKLGPDRAALPAIALTANTSDLTAIGNDYGFDHVFARLIQAHGEPGDVAIGLSTSGNSPNVLAALDEARQRGMATLAFTGRDGGKLPGRADLVFVVPSEDTQRIQEAHVAMLHAICEVVDRLLFPELADA